MASKYSVTLAAEDGYSAAFRGFSEAAENMQESIRGQQAELRDLNRIGKQMDGYRSLQGDLQATSAALDDAREKQARLSREMRETEQPSKRLSNQYDKATATVAGLTAEHRSQTNELGRLQGSLEGAGVDLNRFADEQQRIEDATRQTNAALEDQRARMQAVSDAQGRVTAIEGRMSANREERGRLRGEMVETMALGYLATRPMNSAMDMETAMADVSKVISFAEGEREQYANANLRLASDRLIASSGIRGTDIADIQYAAGQSGIFGEMEGQERFDGVMEFTRQAAIMAAAFDVSAGDAGSAMVSWRQGMNLNNEQALQLADATNRLGNNFNTTAADLTELLTRQGAVATTAGLSAEEAAALGAAFLNPGTQREVAATGFKNFILRINQGGATTDKRRAQWNELGFEPEELARRMQQDAPSVIKEVLTAIRAAPADEQSAITETLFGTESIGAISPLLTNLDAVDKAFNEVSSSARYSGSMLREAEGVADTSRTTWNVMTAEASRLITQIGNGMLPVFEALAPPITAVIGYMADFTEQNTELVGVLAAGAAGLIAIKGAVLGVRYAGLLIGQVGSQGALMRARLDQRTAQTALAADGAVGRLNAAIGRLAAAGGAAGAGGAGKNGRKGAGMGNTAAAGAAAAGTAAAAGSASRATPGVQNGWRAWMANAGNSRAGQVAGKVALPVALTAGAIGVANAMSGEDSTAEDVGGTAGSLIGGMAGWQAGAAGGAALGTMVFPGVGTAAGGLVGGVAGGIAGTKVGQWAGQRFGAGWNWAFGDDEGAPEGAEPASRASSGGGILGTGSGSFTQQVRQAASPVTAQAAEPPPMLAMPAAASAGENSPANSAGGILGGSGKFTEDVRAAATEHRAAIDALDERLANPPSLLAAPSEVAGSITQTNQTDSRVISPTFDIKIEPTGDANRDQELLDRLMAMIEQRLMPMMGGGTSGLDVRLGASLTDRSD